MRGVPKKKGPNKATSGVLPRAPATQGVSRHNRACVGRSPAYKDWLLIAAAMGCCESCCAACCNTCWYCCDLRQPYCTAIGATREAAGFGLEDRSWKQAFGVPSNLGRCLPPSVFLALRCLLLLFWLGITLWSGIDREANDEEDGNFFIYLTHWGMLWELMYLFLAPVLGILATYGSERIADGKGAETPLFARIVYCLQSVTYHTSFFIFIWYWAAVYSRRDGASEYKLHALTVFTHGFNFAVALVDLLLAGLPPRLAHLWATIVFYITYVVFSLVYDLRGILHTWVWYSTHPEEFQWHIYEVMNWRGRPAQAALIVNASTFLFFPLIVLCCIHVVYPLRALFQCCPETHRAYALAKTEATLLNAKCIEP